MTPTSPTMIDRESGSSHARARARRYEIGGEAAKSWLISGGLDADRDQKSWQQTAPGQNLFRRFQGQPNDIRVGAAVLGHNEFPVFLDRVAAGLVQRVHLADVGG